MPISSPNYTQFPDELLDFYMAQVSDSEWRVLCYIVRHTFGFGKKVDAISYKQFLHGVTRHDGSTLDMGCGIKNATTLRKALDGLEGKRIICREHHEADNKAKQTATYGLVIEDHPLAGVNATPTTVAAVGYSTKRSTPTPSAVVTLLRQPQLQETRIQETYKQETQESGGASAPRADKPRRPAPTPIPDDIKEPVKEFMALFHEQVRRVPDTQWVAYQNVVIAGMQQHTPADLLGCLRYKLTDPAWRLNESKRPQYVVDDCATWVAKGRPAQHKTAAVKPLDLSGTGPSTSALYEDRRTLPNRCPECDWLNGKHAQGCTRKGGAR